MPGALFVRLSWLPLVDLRHVCTRLPSLTTRGPAQKQPYHPWGVVFICYQCFMFMAGGQACSGPPCCPYEVILVTLRRVGASGCWLGVYGMCELHTPHMLLPLIAALYAIICFECALLLALPAEGLSAVWESLKQGCVSSCLLCSVWCGGETLGCGCWPVRAFGVRLQAYSLKRFGDLTWWQLLGSPGMGHMGLYQDLSTRHRVQLMWVGVYCVAVTVWRRG
jgi:hypothetical protein